MRFFLIDRVLEVGDDRVVGLKNITLSEQVMHDHFPDHPIYPGTLIIEAAAQLAGFLLERSETIEPPRRSVLVQIEKAKFRRTAAPGDQLTIEVSVLSRLAASARVRAEVRVGDDVLATATLQFSMRQVPSARVHEQRQRLYDLWTRDC